MFLTFLHAGDVCSSEPLEAGSPPRSGSHFFLRHLPALLHSLWADVRPSALSVILSTTFS